MGKAKDKTKGSVAATGKRVSVRKKVVQEVVQEQSEDEEMEQQEVVVPKKRRGRPKKKATVEDREDSPLPSDDAVVVQEQQDQAPRDGTPGSTPRSTPRAKKKRRPETTMPELEDDEEDSAVEWIRSNPVLYNRKHPRFKEVQYRERLWEDEAARLGISAEQLKLWWDSLRHTYCRATRPPKSGSGVVRFSERTTWIVQKLAFLQPYIARFHGLSPVNLETLAPGRGVPRARAVDIDVEDGRPDSDHDLGTDSEAGTSHRQARVPRKRKSEEERDELLRRRDESKELQATIQELLKKPEQDPKDPKHVFGMQFLSLISEMDDSLYREFYRAGQQFILEWQDRNWERKDEQKNPMPPGPPLAQRMPSFQPSFGQQQFQGPPPFQQAPLYQPQQQPFQQQPAPRLMSSSMSSSIFSAPPPPSTPATSAFQNPGTPSDSTISAVSQALSNITELH